MLSAVLKSSRAINVNIEIMRTFVRLRRLLLSQEELARKLLALEERYDRQFKVVFDAIRQIMAPDFLPSVNGSDFDRTNHNASALARATASGAPLFAVARSTSLGASVREPELRRFALEPSPAPLGLNAVAEATAKHRGSSAPGMESR